MRLQGIGTQPTNLHLSGLQRITATAFFLMLDMEYPRAMPFRISEENDYLVIRLRGAVGPADLVEMAQALRGIEEQSPPRDRLIDLTGIESTTTAYPEVAELAENRRKLPFKAWIRSAILTASPRQYGFARMFQTLNDNPRIEIRIFDNRQAAMNWIRPARNSDDAP